MIRPSHHQAHSRFGSRQLRFNMLKAVRTGRWCPPWKCNGSGAQRSVNLGAQSQNPSSAATLPLAILPHAQTPGKFVPGRVLTCIRPRPSNHGPFPLQAINLPRCTIITYFVRGHSVSLWCQVLFYNPVYIQRRAGGTPGLQGIRVEFCCFLFTPSSYCTIPYFWPQYWPYFGLWVWCLSIQADRIVFWDTDYTGASLFPREGVKGER
ncbi:hypothetical protein N656DRAFT_558951 [Canariomyces notabilis]|uniref:Uncharacterized protein n=1 Tax=Canariomyces notabilis TaxID=2074819 RepID=A0AAN6QGV2_9PEZI|nr:hypothetical protein N656DRAFT_558951 [Canariomyces arenarius]